MTATVMDAYNLFHKGSIVLAEIESNGMAVDVNYLDRMIRRINGKIKRLEEELKQTDEYAIWKRSYGHDTKLWSTIQLAHVLFDKLKHPCKHLTPTGRPKTSEAALESIDLPFVKKYFEVKHLKKAKGTYLDGIKRETVNGFIHPFISLGSSPKEEEGGASTYRSSCTDPNVMNQPTRNAVMAKIVRKCYVPRSKNNRLVEIDYSALEFRGAACFWKDPLMIEYASDPTKDVHRDQAALCFKCKKSEVTKEDRYCGKNQFVFPILYGSYYKQCARNLWESIDKMQLTLADGTPLKEHLRSKGIRELGRCDPKEDAVPGTFEYHIKEVESGFNKRFPVFAASKDKWYNDYRKSGSFPLLTGFVLTGLFSKNQCMNTPIQGPMFHCLLWSLIQMQKFIRRNKLRSKIVMEIHDSMLLDVPDDEMQIILNAAKHIMTEAIRKHWDWIVTPLDIEVEATPCGMSWYDKEPWICEDGEWKAKVFA